MDSVSSPLDEMKSQGSMCYICELLNHPTTVQNGCPGNYNTEHLFVTCLKEVQGTYIQSTINKYSDSDSEDLSLSLCHTHIYTHENP